MAQIVQIPVEFEFRKVPVSWAYGQATVLNWREWNYKDRHDLILGEVTCAVNVGTEIRSVRMQAWPFVRPDAQETLFTGAFRGNIASLCNASLPVFVCADRKESSARISDPWTMREEFQRLKPDIPGFLRFLMRWGKYDRSEATFVSDLEVLHWSVRRALVSPPEQWLGGVENSLPSFGVRDEFPFYKISTDFCYDAIKLTVTIDMLKKSRFRVCRRPDCAIRFKVTSEHERYYCSQACAHLESVRRNRRYPKVGKLTRKE